MPEPTSLYIERHIDQAIKLFEKNVPLKQWPSSLVGKFERWAVAHEINLKYHFKGAEFVRSIFMIRYKINETTARQDLRAAESFYGKLKQDNRGYRRILRIEHLEKQSYAAAAEGKYKEVAALEAIIQKYLDPKDDPIELPDWDDLRAAVQPTIEYNPELMDVERMPLEDVQKLWQSVQNRKKIDISDAVLIKDNPTKKAAKSEEDNA